MKKSRMQTELGHTEAMDKLEIKTKRELAAIEVSKFKQTVDAIGKKTIIAIARAGPESQAKLLGSLGLKGFMILDGKHPINLFNTANGMLSNPGKALPPSTPL